MAGKAWERVSFGAAAAKPPADIDFCLPNLVAGGVGTVAADAGIGKTSLLLQLAASVAAGIPLAGGALGAPRITGRVVFLGAEDPPAVLERRAHFLVESLAAQGHGADVLERLESRFQLLSLVGQAPKLLPIIPELASIIDRFESMAEGARLFVIDPIRSFHDCNEHDYGLMSLLFQMLKDMARRRRCTIVFSHHVDRRSAGGQRLAADGDADTPEGLTPFVNLARWVLNMRSMTADQARKSSIPQAERANYVHVSIAKSNYGAPLAPFWLRRSARFEGIFEHVPLPAHAG